MIGVNRRSALTPAPLPNEEGRLELPFSLGRRGRDEGWAAAIALLLAAGCADLRWHKDGADSTALSHDLDDCTRLARAQAAREAFPPGPYVPRVVGTDAQGRAIMSSPGPAEPDRFLVEHDLASSCMRGRGYELVPKSQ